MIIPGHVVTYVPHTHQVDKDSLLRKHAFYVLKIPLSIFRTCTVNDGNQHCSSRSQLDLMVPLVTIYSGTMLFFLGSFNLTR
jgi:hypothetical protein